MERGKHKIYQGDVLEQLCHLKDDSVHVCVTSPPYYGLRSYLPKESNLKQFEIGDEESPEEYIEMLVSVFRQVRRSLHPCGLLFLNLGESYEQDGDKGLLGVPWRVAFALQQDGWLFRQCIVWSKKSPMPENLKGWRWEEDGPEQSLRKGRGRCTTSHEFVFVMAKSQKYYWASEPLSETSNPRSVWHIASEYNEEFHFAVYPSELVRRCLSVSSSDGGCCDQCRTPYAPVIEDRVLKTHKSAGGKRAKADLDGTVMGRPSNNGANSLRNGYREMMHKVMGYRQSCQCENSAAVPCLVVDPFSGSGTTLQTATWMGRNAIGFELNPEFVEIARKKIQEPPVWYLKQKGLARSKPEKRKGLLEWIEGGELE